MIAGFRSIVAPLVVIAALGATAQAQYGYYPGGGGYGWGGWGGYGGGVSPGNIAAGIGAFNAQTGYAAQEVAQARSINADTAMRWNNYVYQSALNANTMEIQHQLGITKARSEAIVKQQRKIRDDPSQGDIYRGSALNAALAEISNPKIDWRNLRSAGTKIPGSWIREIPFQKASAAITMSVDDLTKGGPPDALKVKDFEADREKLRATAAELRKQGLESGEFDPETLEKARSQVRAVREKAEKKYPANSRERNDSERYLKALLGLLKMLDTPAADVLFSGLEKHPEVSIADLISFMKAYSFRFGVANKPEQKEIYSRLYPLLVKLRDEADAGDPYAQAPPEPSPDRHANAGEFFSGMQYQHVDPKAAPPPADNPQ